MCVSTGGRAGLIEINAAIRSPETNSPMFQCQYQYQSLRGSAAGANLRKPQVNDVLP